MMFLTVFGAFALLVLVSDAAVWYVNECRAWFADRPIRSVAGQAESLEGPPAPLIIDLRDRR
jgi:hypothetical protein